VTNACCESVNAKIQWIKRMACGYRNRERFRMAIMFHCGGLDLLVRPPIPWDTPLRKAAPETVRWMGQEEWSDGKERAARSGTRNGAQGASAGPPRFRLRP